MATVEELRTVMRMELSQYNKDLQKLYGVNNAAAKKVEASWLATNKKLDGIGKSMARNISGPLAGVGAALATREVLAYADAWTSAKNSLAVAGVVGRQQASVLEALYRSAQANAAPIGAMADLYGKAAQASDNLGASQQDLLNFADGVGVALKVAGTSAGAASGTLTQLGQLLGSARVQAEEFNSVNEGARPILMAVANGLDEAGGSVNRLKQLVNDGKVSGQQFFQAFLKGLPSIQAMAANSTQTIDQGITKVRNALTKYIGETDSSLGASQRLVAGLNALADNFDTVADATLIFAGILAGGLLGRSMTLMVTRLGLGAKGVLDLVAAFQRVRQVGIAQTLGSVSAALGPIGALLGTVAAGAALYFGTQAAEASQRTERLREEMDALGILADDLSPKVDKASKSIENLAPDQVRKRLRDINDELEAMNSRSWGNLFGGSASTLGDVKIRTRNIQLSPNSSATDKSAAKQMQDLISQAEKGEISLDDVRKRLDEIGKLKVSQGIDELIDALRKAIPYMKSLRDYADQAGKSASSISVGSQDADKADFVRVAKDRRETQEFLDERTSESKKSSLDKEIDARAKSILDAAQKVGKSLDEAAAKIQARTELENEARVKAGEASVSSTADVIKYFENFSAKPYWDVNAYRAGYGSDTVTLADGSIQKITQGMTVSVTDANRDLTRRIGEFQAGIRSKIGGSTFDAMSSNQQAALTSIAYNYGSLPDRIVAAIKSGSEEQVYTAIKGLGSDNGGVNRTRRNKEAELYLSGTTVSTQSRVETAEGFAQTIEQQKQRIAQLKEETALQSTLNPLVDDYGQAMSTLQAAQYLLTEAQREGTAAGKELSSVQQLLHGDLSSLSPEARKQAEAMRQLAAETGNAEAASNRLADQQGKLKQNTQEWNDLSKNATKGFIQDLLNGKSAAEALSNALQKVADKLLDEVLDAIFQVNSASGSGGGSWLSGAIGGFFKLLGFKNGGQIKAYAGGGKLRGEGTGTSDSMLIRASDGEYMVNAKSTEKYLPLLEAINKDKLPAFATGGLIGTAGLSPVTGPRIPDVPRMSASRGVAANVSVGVTVDEEGNLRAFVKDISQKEATSITQAGIATYDSRRLPYRIKEINANPRKVG